METRTEDRKTNELKQYNNVTEQPAHKVFNYARDLGRWVTFKSGKKKMKLRKYVRRMAVMINTINGRGDEVNRQNIILNYNNYGFEGIRAYINEELETIKKVVS